MIYSFTDYNGISDEINFVGLKNYSSIFTNDRFFKAMMFNIKYSIILIIAIMLLSLVLSLILSKNGKGKSFFKSMYFFPAVLPGLTMALVFNGLFTQAIPQLGALLGRESWEISLLSKGSYAMYAILFVHIWKGTAIPTVLLMAGLQTVPDELYESAAIDGANKWERFTKITVPFLIPTFTIIFVLVLKEGLMVYDLIMGMTGGGPSGATESMALLIYKHGFEERQLSAAMAESMVLALIVSVVSVIQISWSNRQKIYD